MLKSIEKIFLGCTAIAVMALSACEKMVAIDPPLNEVTNELVFSSDKLATSALSGMYTGLAQAATQSTYTPVYNALFADDLIYTGVNPTYSEVYNNSYTSISTFQATIFQDWYSTIYRANSIIEGLQKYQGTSDRVKKQFTAEAKVFRAYCYFNLINTFGDVPLVLTTDVTVTAFLPKETVARVYEQIIADLTAAKADLPADYSATSGSRLGVNRLTAAALLARVSLFTGNYAAAESNATEVISSGLFSIIPAADMATGVWVKNNAESIWQMSSPINVINQYTVEAQTFLPAFNATPQFDIRDDLINLYSNSDLRPQRWMRVYGAGALEVVLPYKYKYTTQADAVAAGVAESPTVLRLAEQYLIRAEAKARIGADLTGARDDMNVIRSRAETAESTTADQATLINEILLEGRKEFFCEQSHRWFNLKRTGQADVVLETLKTGYRPISKLLPIPTAAIDANPNLVQNPGYN
ncbi:hypothetical protein PBAL39_21210 [Pedobacter sp. BAL39]|uniref:RagB/SusD family nutrient uptake outer membrane protein n=1 Tax=Pedobacter sp. BAL39 TaxID=391596 RepID=UPI0001559A6E|nr:RagB/SusD family nutrient uptake outer membrane protein [Pedobacter sp. BAL39]EDM38633.1 hypothetical protein PBAL39_21210 [Pedobacter sp. BAL39]